MLMKKDYILKEEPDGSYVPSVFLSLKDVLLDPYIKNFD